MTTQWHAKRGYDGTTVERGVLGAALTAGGRGIDFYDTDASTWYKWDGTAWGAFGPGADHGLLSGLADDDHLQYIFNAPTASTRNVIEPTGPTIRPLAIELAAAQSANAFEVLVQGGATILSSINSSGNFNVSPIDTAGTNVAFATKQAYSDATHSYCFRGDLLHNTALNVGAIQGIRVSVEKRGTGDVTALAGGNFAVQIGNESPAVTAYYGIIGQANVAAGATPTINNVYNLFFSGTLREAVINNAYGILTNPGKISTGSITNAYGGQFKTGEITAAGTITNSWGVRIISGAIHGTGTLTNLYGLYINDMDAAITLNYAILTNAGNVVLNEGGDANTDFRVEVDTEDNFLFIDGGLEWLRIGDWDTNYIEIDKGGDTHWVGGGGLIFGSFWGNEIGWTSVAFGGGGTFVVISDAAITAGQTHNTTFQGNQELDIGAAGEGMYLVTYSMSAKATGANKHIVSAIGVDPAGVGAPAAQNDGRNHVVSVGNAEFALAGDAILDLSNDSEVMLMITNETDNTQVTVEHVNLTIVQIGGT